MNLVRHFCSRLLFVRVIITVISKLSLTTKKMRKTMMENENFTFQDRFMFPKVPLQFSMLQFSPN